MECVSLTSQRGTGGVLLILFLFLDDFSSFLFKQRATSLSAELLELEVAPNRRSHTGVLAARPAARLIPRLLVAHLATPSLARRSRGRAPR